MIKQLLILLITFSSIKTYSQIIFEKGYYIDNNNQKVNCLIKNVEWKNNPTTLEYKLSESSTSKIASIENIKEFGILNISKYLRATVNIDRSSMNISQMTFDKRPIFHKETLFLKVLVEGKANLYLYEDINLKRYFYNKDASNIEQLVYKKYKTTDRKIGENNRFRNQLWNDLKCEELNIKSFKNLNYHTKELVNFFIDYNTCGKGDYINYNKKQKRDLFNLNLRAGVNNSSLTIQYGDAMYYSEFDNKNAFRFGVEAEFIFPYNKNKWAVIFEPTYQSYKSEADIRYRYQSKKDKAEYKSIEFPIGIRHYFFFNDTSAMFVNASIIYDSSNNSSFINLATYPDKEIKTDNINFALGVGYKYNDRFSLEFRYHTNRNLFSQYTNWDSDYKNMSLILGYTIF